MTTEPTAKHRVEAEKVILVWTGGTLLVNAIASALASRDTEIREVLQGLRTYWTNGGCWCRNIKYRPRVHEPACLAAKKLWSEVQV